MTTKEMINILQAFDAGKPIQRIHIKDDDPDNWEDIIPSRGDIVVWDFNKYIYRIKPQSEYVPFDYTEELVGTNVTMKNRHMRTMIIHQNEEGVTLGNGHKCSYKDLLEMFTFSDSSPVGILNED
jgi:hypothetical protein